jgi:polar amino acid transport system substrate-binding protein
MTEASHDRSVACPKRPTTNASDDRATFPIRRAVRNGEHEIQEMRMKKEKFAKKARMLALLGLASCLMASAASAKEWKALRFGMDASYAPFESVDPSGKIVGFEVDYASALCERMKVTCTFQNQDWDGIIPALLAGKFDAIFSSMNITDERKKKVMFSDMYYATPIVFAGQASNKSDDVSLPR